MRELKLPLHWRSVKKAIRGGITATVGMVATQICLCNKLKIRRSTQRLRSYCAPTCHCQSIKQVSHHHIKHKCVSETARLGLEFQNLQIEQADEKYFVENIKYAEDLGSIQEDLGVERCDPPYLLSKCPQKQHTEVFIYHFPVLIFFVI